MLYAMATPPIVWLVLALLFCYSPDGDLRALRNSYDNRQTKKTKLNFPFPFDVKYIQISVL